MKSSLSILIILVIAAILAFIGWSRLPDMIATNMAKKLQVAVSIGRMGLGPKSLKIKKMHIGNPSGYSTLPKAFSSEQILIHAPLTRYMDQKIVIDQIDINEIYLGLEFDSASGTNGNWTVIMSNFQRATKVEKIRADKQKSILIKRLSLRNIKTELVFLKEKTSVKRLPTIDEIVLTDITSEGGLPMDQLMNTVLGQMLKSVFQKQNLQNMLKGLLDSPEKAIDTFMKPFKGIFNTNFENKTSLCAQRLCLFLNA